MTAPVFVVDTNAVGDWAGGLGSALANKRMNSAG